MRDDRPRGGRDDDIAVRAAHVAVVRQSRKGRTRKVPQAPLAAADLNEPAFRQPYADILDHVAGARVGQERLRDLGLTVEKRLEPCGLPCDVGKVEPDVPLVRAVREKSLRVNHAQFVHFQLVRQMTEQGNGFLLVVPVGVRPQLGQLVAKKHRLPDEPAVHLLADGTFHVLEGDVNQLVGVVGGHAVVQHPCQRQRGEEGQRHSSRQPGHQLPVRLHFAFLSRMTALTASR